MRVLQDAAVARLVLAVFVCVLILLLIHNAPSQTSMEFQKKQLPPAEYDHEFDGELIIVRETMEAISERCRSIIKTPGGKAIGCSKKGYIPPGEHIDFPIDGRPITPGCTIWIVTDDELKQMGWDYDIVFRHERAHCNGWRHANGG